jgi:hypothetical protein
MEDMSKLGWPDGVPEICGQFSCISCMWWFSLHSNIYCGHLRTHVGLILIDANRWMDRWRSFTNFGRNGMQVWVWGLYGTTEQNMASAAAVLLLRKWKPVNTVFSKFCCGCNRLKSDRQICNRFRFYSNSYLTKSVFSLNWRKMTSFSYSVVWQKLNRVYPASAFLHK